MKLFILIILVYLAGYCHGRIKALDEAKEFLDEYHKDMDGKEQK